VRLNILFVFLITIITNMLQITWKRH